MYAWERYREVKSGFNLMWAVGFTITGAEDMIHATLGLMDFSLVAVWVPWTWATARLTLCTQLILASVWAKKGMSVKTAINACIFSAVTSLILIYPGWAEHVQFVYIDGIVKRPLDLGLAVLWAIAFISLVRVPAAKVQAPALFKVFLALGFMCHIVMAFGSSKSLDGAFMLAHYMKVIEYAVWLGAVVWEHHLSTKLSGGYLEMYVRQGQILKLQTSVDSLTKLRDTLSEGLPSAQNSENS